MGLTRGFSSVFFLILLFASVSKAHERRIKIFDVRKYGAVADGRRDNTKVINLSAITRRELKGYPLIVILFELSCMFFFFFFVGIFESLGRGM